MASKEKDVMPRLPISKCKRIAKTDPDYILTTQPAYIATAFATELFIQSISEESVAMAQLESRKQLKGKQIRMNYTDLARAVSRLDKFSFLGDVIPETKVLSHLVQQNKVRYSTPAPHDAIRGQAILPFKKKDGIELGGDGRDHMMERIPGAELHNLEGLEVVSEDEQVEESELQKEMEEVAKMNQVADLDNEDSSDGYQDAGQDADAQEEQEDD
ncbi:histone-fold protein Ecym_6281 [Eremothecium cymbalariae DBVPG|uniref:Transcription factor CBF/NF-Y/archaeal histone domain-containing protein n=1 Tax=Eremothecium cymbalariae (strain CBS 270.75 / DBVPG 7215 / KCTC 17166 / NRRL Y-17582) TaxID=931890 RepID=G8JVI2_ERECY|nr:hypothetical protein Ecym_6281 [Eremothecium cymbalariae DBVPG\